LTDQTEIYMPCSAYLDDARCEISGKFLPRQPRYKKWYFFLQGQCP